MANRGSFGLQLIGDLLVPVGASDRMYGPAAFRNSDYAWGAEVAESGVFDRLAGGGLDGNTHASLVSLADRLASNHLRHQTLDAFVDPFRAFSRSRTRVRRQVAITFVMGRVEDLLVA